MKSAKKKYSHTAHAGTIKVEAHHRIGGAPRYPSKKVKSRRPKSRSRGVKSRGHKKKTKSRGRK